MVRVKLTVKLIHHVHHADLHLEQALHPKNRQLESLTESGLYLSLTLRSNLLPLVCSKSNLQTPNPVAAGSPGTALPALTAAPGNGGAAGRGQLGVKATEGMSVVKGGSEAKLLGAQGPGRAPRRLGDGGGGRRLLCRLAGGWGWGLGKEMDERDESRFNCLDSELTAWGDSTTFPSIRIKKKGCACL